MKKFKDKYAWLFISSDYSDTLESDCIAVPKTAKRMRAIGVDEKVINNVVYKNPKRLFKLQ